MIFKKILVPLDGSEHSRRALETAVELAKKLDGKLTLLTVYSMTVVPVTSPEMALHAPATIPDATSAALSQMAVEGARNQGKKILTAAEEKVKSENIAVETQLAEGNAAEIIVRKSREEHFDMIVMGARGLGTIRKLFIGSVSEGVIKGALCPVLIVK